MARRGDGKINNTSIIHIISVYKLQKPTGIPDEYESQFPVENEPLHVILL